MNPVRFFLENFEEIETKRNLKERRRRIGSELKFPLVSTNARAAESMKTKALWDFLSHKGWTPLVDPYTKDITGASKQGEMNNHLASCETGFCKVEFSLAHTDDLLKLHKTIAELKGLLRQFSEEQDVAFLGFGLQPLTPPGKHLLMEKSRNLFWDKLFGGNDYIPEAEGTDVHLFTVSASSQVHIDVTMDEAVDAINVFNGLSGAQIAMTANSSIWKGAVSPDYKCLSEMFWDWWLKEKHAARYGVPEKKFQNLEDYFHSVLQFPPVYVKREGIPVALPCCPTFSDFYFCSHNNEQCQQGMTQEKRCGLTADGDTVEISHEEHDFSQHFTFFWHNARLSRYYTLENRINDQQPPDELMTIPALTLGIMENLDDAVNLINDYSWEFLKESRLQAARFGLDAQVQGKPVSELSQSIVEIADKGLKKRGLGEENFLTPLKERLELGFCPADIAARIFKEQGPEEFVKIFRIT
jgi:gamma-glutamylcysteine synthetase